MTPTAVVFPRDSWRGRPCLHGALPVASAEGGEALAGSSTLIRSVDDLPHFMGQSKSHGFSGVGPGARGRARGPGMPGQRPPGGIQGPAGGKEGHHTGPCELGQVGLELL